MAAPKKIKIREAAIAPVAPGISRAEPTDIGDYWAKRRNHDLYRLTLALARASFFDAKSAIDVGCHTSGLICEMDWIGRRVAADRKKHLVENWAGVRGVDFIAGDAFKISFPEPFDLVISNQTIEHVDDPKRFVRKLLKLGRGLIISTTYEVETGLIDGHVQDPISLEKFKSWFPCELDVWMVCHHPTARHIRHVIAVVRQSHPARRPGG